MPLAEKSRSVTGIFHNLCESDFVNWHVDLGQITTVPVPLRPIRDAAPLRVSSRKQSGTGGAANTVTIGLSQANASGCQPVHVGGEKVVGSKAVRIQRSLVVRKKQHNIWPNLLGVGTLETGYHQQCENDSEMIHRKACMESVSKMWERRELIPLLYSIVEALKSSYASDTQ